MPSISANSASAATQAVNSPINTSGGVGGALNNQRDAKEAATDAKFGDVLQNIQAKYGSKAEKPREIKKTLGKDDFLRIMITQMRHQDPTNPFKAEQMATEMAQFTSVEQLQNLNQNFQKMAEKNAPLERMAMTNLIGKSVTVDRNRFAHVDGQNDTLSYNLSRPASEVHVAIITEAGEVVLEKDLGPQKQGETAFNWDGVRGNTLPAKGGNYVVRIEAKDEHGNAIPTDGQRKVRVVGVSFEGGEAVLLVGDNRRQDKISMKIVTRIEGDAPVIPGATPMGGGAQSGASEIVAPGNSQNFFSFQKGVGSGELNPALASPEIQAALAKFQQQPAYSAASAPIKAEGFPNGLQDNDSNTKLEGGGE